MRPLQNDPHPIKAMARRAHQSVQLPGLQTESIPSAPSNEAVWPFQGGETKLVHPAVLSHSNIPGRYVRTAAIRFDETRNYWMATVCKACMFHICAHAHFWYLWPKGHVPVITSNICSPESERRMANSSQVLRGRDLSINLGNYNV